MASIFKVVGGVVLFLALMAVVTISRGDEAPLGSECVKAGELH
jgi:hypothetical protein